MKSASFTIKMARDTKETLNKFCEENGFKINKFIEKAVIREISREKTKEDLIIYQNYIENDRNTAVDYHKFAKKMGMKEK